MSKPATRAPKSTPPPPGDGRGDGHDDATWSEGGAPRACPACGRTFPADFLVCPRDGAPLGVAANETDPLVGALLGNSYRIERAIARGGMGRLYQAAHTRLPRRVAVKVLHEPHAQKKDAVRRFEREASALARIDSPHVVPVLDFVRTPDGRGAIVTPLLDGEDLQSLLERETAIPAEEAVRIALEMCRGLAAAHAEGIVHRDLKPSNVFLARRADGPTVAKLLDFGVAKLGEEDMTRTGVVLGTPAYMAPEQASGSARVDARADVYGVGAVLYRMVAGRMPYEGDDAGQVLKKLLAAAPRRPSHYRPVPQDVEAVIQRAMAREPDERFGSARALGDALEQIATGTRSTTGAVPAVGSPSLLEARAIGVAVVAGSALATSAAVAGLAWTSAAALGASSDSAQAFVTALVLVGSLASLGGVGWGLGRELAGRWESGAELAAFRRRWGAAAAAGLATLGVAQLALLAAGASAPATEAGAVAVSGLVGALVPLRRRRA